jgi:hypothetical protein
MLHQNRSNVFKFIQRTNLQKELLLVFELTDLECLKTKMIFKNIFCEEYQLGNKVFFNQSQSLIF